MPERLCRSGLALIIAAAILLLDQGTKAAAQNTLSQQHRIPLLGDLLGLQLAFNPGSIFSLGADSTAVITLIGVGVTACLFIAASRTRTTSAAVAFGFLLGGAVGNLTDRLFAPPAFGRGHVTDFLAYGDLFIGNLADVALGIGAAILLGSALTARRTPPRNAQEPLQQPTKEIHP
ncbi:signal peptidase II [uncultured Microbacterium sp.]|uniref:signal peptidase II n=1 Tax=uncultured Microbacterium sp. TaxID=191216 RepID=UPI0028DC1F50|nr:signal peptidase II [uncultured Microbacterium sp.]